MFKLLVLLKKAVLFPSSPPSCSCHPIRPLMLFWAHCAVQMLLLSLSKAGRGTDLTEELNCFSNQFFFCLEQLSGGVHPTHACVGGMQGAEQRPLIDRAGATHLLGESPSQVTLLILHRTLFITKQDLVITTQRLLDKERMESCSCLSKGTGKRDMIIMY